VGIGRHAAEWGQVDVRYAAAEAGIERHSKRPDRDHVSTPGEHAQPRAGQADRRRHEDPDDPMEPGKASQIHPRTLPAAPLPDPAGGVPILL